MTEDRSDRRSANGVEAEYQETETERIVSFRAGDRTAAIAQNKEGYAMLKVRARPDGDELERYYGFEMALDHAAELLGLAAHDLPIPDAADDLGM